MFIPDITNHTSLKLNSKHFKTTQYNPIICLFGMGFLYAQSKVYLQKRCDNTWSYMICIKDPFPLRAKGTEMAEDNTQLHNGTRIHTCIIFTSDGWWLIIIRLTVQYYLTFIQWMLHLIDSIWQIVSEYHDYKRVKQFFLVNW